MAPQLGTGSSVFSGCGSQQAPLRRPWKKLLGWRWGLLRVAAALPAITLVWGAPGGGQVRAGAGAGSQLAAQTFPILARGISEVGV